MSNGMTQLHWQPTQWKDQVTGATQLDINLSMEHSAGAGASAG